MNAGLFEKSLIAFFDSLYYVLNCLRVKFSEKAETFLMFNLSKMLFESRFAETLSKSPIKSFLKSNTMIIHIASDIDLVINVTVIRWV